MERTAALDVARTCTCYAEEVVGVVLGDEEEEVGGDDGFVVGLTMVGRSLLFYVASRVVTYPRDGRRAVVCPVSMRVVTAARMIVYALLLP